MARSKNRRKKRNTKKARKLQPENLELLIGIYKKLKFFNHVTIGLFMLVGMYMVFNLSDVNSKLEELPKSIRYTYLGLWIMITIYRAYLVKAYNKTKMMKVMLSKKQTSNYAKLQVVSTLTSLLFGSIAIFYLSGLFDSISIAISYYLNGLDPRLVTSALAVCATILWNIIWDSIKWIFRGKK